MAKTHLEIIDMSLPAQEGIIRACPVFWHKSTFQFYFSCPIVFLWLGILLLPNYCMYAQSLDQSLSHIHFESISLPNRTATSITQDAHGFMWVGTFDGLYKYDGFDITSYRHDPEDSSSISDSWISALYVDRQGTLWVGTEQGGLNRFFPESDTFARYSHDPENPSSLSHNLVRSIVEDKTGVLWIGTEGGLNKFDHASESFTRYVQDPDDPTSLSNNSVKAVYEDSEGLLWIGTTGSHEQPDLPVINRFDREKSVFYRYGALSTSELIDNRIYSISEVNKNQLLVGSCEAGLYTYDRKEDIFTRIHLDHLSLYPAFVDVESAPCILDIYQETIGEKAIWIASANGGLTRYDADLNQYTHFIHEPTNPNGLAHNRILDIQGDRMGSLWVGTLEGLNKIDPSFGEFRTYRHHPGIETSISHEEVYTIVEGQQKQIWVVTPNGLNRLDPQQAVFYQEGIDPNTIREVKSNYVRGLLKDRDGTLWVGTADGLGIFDPTSKNFEIKFPIPDISGSAINHIDWPMIEDTEGLFWIGNSNGLHHIDPNKGVIHHYEHDRLDTLSISGNNIRSLLQDVDGKIWVGTYGTGLNRLDPETGKFQTTLKGKLITDLFEDSQEILWASTFTGGLFKFHEDGTYIQFTTQEGLPSNEVAAIEEDDTGNLWLSTANGISRFNRETEQFKNFESDLGQQEGRYNWSSSYKSEDGKIYFGGGKGLTSFFPHQINDNPYPPEIALIDLQIFNQSVLIGGDSPLKENILTTNSLELPHHENEISLRFAGLHYKTPENNTYAYKLEGYNEEWQYIGNRRVVSFTSLKPKNYIFSVKGANSDGVWGETRSLSITINPPWWKTTGAYIIYGLLFIAGVLSIDRIQRKRLIAKEREKTRERELAQAKEIEKAYTQLKSTQQQLIQQEKMASLGQLTSGIAHEIKNPLNFVNNFSRLNGQLIEELEDVLETPSDEILELLDDLKQNESRINEHGKRADRIVRSMMEHASGASGERRPVDINALVNEYTNLAYHGMQTKHGDFQVEIERLFDKQAGEVKAVPKEIGRVLINLLNNAFDAVSEKSGDNSPESGVVRVMTVRDGGFVEIRVEDNGVGIPEEMQGKIFEPFFTTKPTGSGTGLGLSLSYDIVTQGHGGELKVESEEGEGATFIVRLPV